MTKQLGVDLTKKVLRMEYKVEQSYTLMAIRNDMGVRVYVMLKKASNDFNVYPFVKVSLIRMWARLILVKVQPIEQFLCLEAMSW